MRIAIFLACSLAVCGFYLYVLVQLYRDEKGLNARKKSLQKYMYEREPEAPGVAAGKIAKTGQSRFASMKRGTRADYNRPRFYPAAAATQGTNAEAKARRDTAISLILGVGGLAVLFAGMELFNSLVTWAH
ncbi:MAG TPA: hypothetical protein VEX69_07105 [Candidatus Limnocylindria bacterium]|nr:hypothetical protein [Candidatus Limnocylindria bacterium]